MTTQSYDVYAIGNAIVDIVRRCDEATVAALRVAKGQMTVLRAPDMIAAVLARIPTNGLEVAGGSAANAAVGIASFGGRAMFCGRIADDEFGRIFRFDMQGAGVGFDEQAILSACHNTSRSLILVTPDGQRTMLTYLGCGSHIELSERDPQDIRASKVVLLEGYLFDNPRAKVTLERVAQIASAAGKPVAFSLPDTLCVARHRLAFQSFIRNHVDILIANEKEAMALYEVARVEDVIGHVGADVKLAAITRSAKGSVLVAKGHVASIAPEPVKRVVDLTGAGDMYAAGFLFGLARNLPPPAAATLGSFAAAEIITLVGPRPQVRLAHLANMRGLMSWAPAA